MIKFNKIILTTLLAIGIIGNLDAAKKTKSEQVKEARIAKPVYKAEDKKKGTPVKDVIKPPVKIKEINDFNDQKAAFEALTKKVSDAKALGHMKENIPGVIPDATFASKIFKPFEAEIAKDLAANGATALIKEGEALVKFINDKAKVADLNANKRKLENDVTAKLKKALEGDKTKPANSFENEGLNGLVTQSMKYADIVKAVSAGLTDPFGGKGSAEELLKDAGTIANKIADKKKEPGLSLENKRVDLLALLGDINNAIAANLNLLIDASAMFTEFDKNDKYFTQNPAIPFVAGTGDFKNFIENVKKLHQAVFAPVRGAGHAGNPETDLLTIINDAGNDWKTQLGLKVVTDAIVAAPALGRTKNNLVAFTTKLIAEMPLGRLNDLDIPNNILIKNFIDLLDAGVIDTNFTGNATNKAKYRKAKGLLPMFFPLANQDQAVAPGALKAEVDAYNLLP